MIVVVFLAELFFTFFQTHYRPFDKFHRNLFINFGFSVIFCLQEMIAIHTRVHKHALHNKSTVLGIFTGIIGLQ